VAADFVEDFKLRAPVRSPVRARAKARSFADQDATEAISPIGFIPSPSPVATPFRSPLLFAFRAS
jgi:hypothetical protein